MKHLLLLTCVAGLAGCTAISTRVVINAPADKVRAIVVDYGAYPSWNPFVVKVAGDMSAGKDVRVTIHPVGQALITGTGHVLASDPDRIAWSGRLGFPGIFSGGAHLSHRGGWPQSDRLLQQREDAGAFGPVL